MIHEGTVTHEEHLVEYSLDYSFCNGEVEVVRFLMNGFELDIWARVEDILIGKAYAQERERQVEGSIYRDEATT